MKLNLKKIRLENSKTQKEVANILGISEFTYSHYETMYNIIPIKHLNNFCSYFNVSIDYVFDIAENKNLNFNNELDKMLIGNRLKEWRKSNKLTQEKLALKLNIAKGTIADYERGRYLIATPFLYTISKKYNISADYLLGRINENYLKEKINS